MLRERLWFVFRKRYQVVKPIAPNSELFGWKNFEFNAVEAFQDDRLRYGNWIAVQNFVGTVLWRNQVYTQKYRSR